MSIKTSIFLFLLMMVFSFSASAQLCRIGTTVGGVYYNKGMDTGTIADFDVIRISSHRVVNGCELHGKSYMVMNGTPVDSCDSGTAYNSTTGVCEAAPICEPPSQLDPDTLECVTLSFCDRESTMNLFLKLSNLVRLRVVFSLISVLISLNR
ncbi:hypothetical protein F0Z19_4017 [Vibrio cyclitrophicus]|nr:hypothetical protein F0Z19_4017 [Vibrio cyclitrophicus]